MERTHTSRKENSDFIVRLHIPRQTHFISSSAPMSVAPLVSPQCPSGDYAQFTDGKLRLNSAKGLVQSYVRVEQNVLLHSRPLGARFSPPTAYYPSRVSLCPPLPELSLRDMCLSLLVQPPDHRVSALLLGSG